MDNWIPPFPVKKIHEEFKIDPDLFIKAWIDSEISLYIKLDGFPCRICRHISPINSEQEKRSWEDKIANGKDVYQDKCSLGFNVRRFYPDLNKHLGFRVSWYPIVENIFDIVGGGGRVNQPIDYDANYNGYAYGYWLVKPRDGCFSNKEYTLSDVSGILSSGKSRTSSIIIFDYATSDYLLISQDVSISSPDLFVKYEDIKMVTSVESIKQRIHNSSSGNNHEKKTDSINYYPALKHRVALYIVIHEWWGRGSSTGMAYKVAGYLKDKYDEHTSMETIARWIERPEGTKFKPRIHSEQIKKLSIFLDELYTEKNASGENSVRCSAADIAKNLTELARGSKYKFDICFSEDDINLWLFKYKK